MTWRLEGTYFENCNCEWVCPCTVSSLVAPATQDRCQVVLVYHIAAGHIDEADVRGMTVAVVADTPRQMTDGNWNLGLIIDANASQDQADRLAAVFSGQQGGPMAALGPLVGKVLGVERAPMDFRDEGLRHSVRIGDAISIEIEDFVPPALGGDTPTRLAGVFHPSNTTLTVAKPLSSRIQAFGMEFPNEGKSAFSAPFEWQG
ncbi:MAG: DUF1326 domain-containing protein [Candidatus Dormibacteraeota bacterium]|uniref:DUF1326 domain-containing protein n=1 Tax=Candidatus Dormiibacter inghamiae TaxID=3127013 RepID=A0A934K8K9_9BACT|nr:DUF1326 domain-containing protein [Candidatus Dormibacteraeota bacterium]MBJ7605766.1 DUF1326 domain-containing protein [Candidatus Dormibacteraeota bacterium]